MNYSSYQKLFVFATLALSIGCSDSSSTASSSKISNEITAAYSAINSQVNKASGISDRDMASILSSDYSAMAAPSFDTDWTNAALLPNPITGSGNISPKDWMGYQLTSDARNSNGSDINIFGRINTALRIFCAVGVAAGFQDITLTSGYPANGAYSITFTDALKSAMSSQCGMDTTSITTGMSMTLTVTSSTGNYDKKYTFDAFDQVYYVKYDSSVVNIATAENQSSGAVSRMILQWNKSTNVMLAEYVHNPGGATSGTNGVYLYRLFYDEPNDDAQMLAYEGDDSSASNSSRYILAGKPNMGDGFSLSAKLRGVLSFSELEACVNGATGDILTDGARCTASSTRTAGAAVSSMDSLYTDFFAQRTATTWFDSMTASTTLGWSTKANMVSAAIVP